MLFRSIIVGALVLRRGTILEPAAPPAPEPPVEQVHKPAIPSVQEIDKTAKTETEVSAPKKINMHNVLSAARGWGPIHTSWYGKEAPDFTMTDINGKEHKLSDYQGRDVMIIFWATWCMPCVIEVPHLISLRNAMGEDELAMLAISNERPGTVKKFTAARKINYTVLLDNRRMPRPYSSITGLQSTFFIDAEGKIKLITEGLISLGEIKAILRAEWP